MDSASKTGNLAGVGLTPLLGECRSMIVWRQPPLLTFGEELAFAAAGNDGFRGFEFQQKLLFEAVVRSLGVPSRILFGACNFSSWRNRVFESSREVVAAIQKVGG